MAIQTETFYSKRSDVLAYIDEIRAAMELLRDEEIEAGVALLAWARRAGHAVYIFGNGGSAATASHLAVDLARNAGGDRPRSLRVLSLTDNAAWLTAAANDDGYENCFADQLHRLVRPGDVVIGISASGNSENVLRAFDVAQAARARRLAMVGLDGGRLATLATVCISVDSHDYGVVESVHVAVCHVLVRMLRKLADEEETLLAVGKAPAGEILCASRHGEIRLQGATGSKRTIAPEF